MKNYHLILLGFAVASSLITTASCSDRSKKADVDSASTSSVAASSAPPAPLTPAVLDPFTEISAALKNATPEQISNLSILREHMERSIGEQIAAGKAAGHVITSADEGKLALARADFTEKIRILSLAGPETWESAKSNALVSLQNVRAAYSQLLSGSPGN